MPNRRKPIVARGGAPQQIDLFADEPQRMIGDMPAWSTLPTEARSALTDLMARLILEHAERSRNGLTAEVVHDL